MDKSLELKLFNYIYGSPAWWEIMPGEAPDFLCIKDGQSVLGSEITELYTDQTDARLNKINGYSFDLLNGGTFRHKDDKKNIKVDRVKYIKKGENDGKAINAIIKKLPNIPKKISLLEKTVKAKECKVDNYLESCPAVDLIINDASNLFWFERYEDIFFPLSRLINRKVIINSRFREIFLLTQTKNNSIVKVPLRLNFFAQDITIIEKLILDLKNENKINKSDKAMQTLLYCLCKSGYDSISLITENNCLGLIVGCHLYLYSKDGKNIRDYSTIPDQLPVGETINESEYDLDSSEKEIAIKILRDRQAYNCCMSLFIKVKNV